MLNMHTFYIVVNIFLTICLGYGLFRAIQMHRKATIALRDAVTIVEKAKRVSDIKGVLGNSDLENAT